MLDSIFANEKKKQKENSLILILQCDFFFYVKPGIVLVWLGLLKPYKTHQKSPSSYRSICEEVSLGWETIPGFWPPNICYGELRPRADIALAWLVDFNLHSRASEYTDHNWSRNWSQLISTEHRGKGELVYEDSDVYPASKLLKTSFRKTNNYPGGLWRRAHQKFRLGISARKIGVREVPVRRADGR